MRSCKTENKRKERKEKKIDTRASPQIYISSGVPSRRAGNVCTCVRRLFGSGSLSQMRVNSCPGRPDERARVHFSLSYALRLSCVTALLALNSSSHSRSTVEMPPKDEHLKMPTKTLSAKGHCALRGWGLLFFPSPLVHCHLHCPRFSQVTHSPESSRERPYHASADTDLSVETSEFESSRQGTPSSPAAPFLSRHAPLRPARRFLRRYSPPPPLCRLFGFSLSLPLSLT